MSYFKSNDRGSLLWPYEFYTLRAPNDEDLKISQLVKSFFERNLILEKYGCGLGVGTSD